MPHFCPPAPPLKILDRLHGPRSGSTTAEVARPGWEMAFVNATKLRGQISSDIEAKNEAIHFPSMSYS